MTQWRRVSTAPMDGTRMLLRLSNGEIFSGWGRQEGGFYRFHADGTDVGWINAKYWMPIPEDPFDGEAHES